MTSTGAAADTPTGAPDGPPAPARRRSGTDRALLTGHQYADGSRLDARRRLYDGMVPVRDLPDLVVPLLPRRPGALIVDAGCGDGVYTARIRAALPGAGVLALDLSAGIARRIPPPRAVADVTRLPLPDGSADAALAMHMLYHVPDPDAALAELRRVLRPGGLLIVATNSATDKQQLRDLRDAAAEGLDVTVFPNVAAHFALEDAADRMARHFPDVDTRLTPLDGTIDLTDPAPALAHLASGLGPAAGDGSAEAELLRRAEALLREAIAREGRFRITSRIGILTARVPQGTPRT